MDGPEGVPNFSKFKNNKIRLPRHSFRILALTGIEIDIVPLRFAAYICLELPDSKWSAKLRLRIAK